jgi:outer membrane immunogenic protein
MKKLLLAATALMVLTAGSAGAADLAVKAPLYKAPPPVVPVWSWTGCYIGGHVGGLWAHKDWTDRTPGDTFFGTSLGGHDANGWLGGVQAGCDYQFAGGFVIGIQGDYAWADAKGSNVDPVILTLTQESKVKSLATVTGRVGYAWDRFLGYVKGGGAWERDDYRLSGTIALAAVTPVDISASQTRSGWTVGIGGEYAFTNFLSGFVEYNYYDFGTHDVTFSNGVSTVGVKETKSVVRAGLNFRFGPGPVVAKY